MDKQLVSVIIPVYNAKKTIGRCIASVQAQTYKQIEIIIINDGSTDKSAQIIENISNHDKRIHFFTQKNQGVSAARNRGIKHATGNYIQFVDADDWIEKTMTAQLVAQMNEDVDLVICGYQTAQKHIHPEQAGTYEEAIWQQTIGNLYEQSLLHSPCNKLYKQKHIQKHQLAFQHGLSIGEDFLFNLNYLTHTRKIALQTTVPYIYCHTETSLTRSYQADLFAIQKQLHEAWETFLIKNDCHTTANQTAGKHVFIQGTAFSIHNLYHAPWLSTTIRYNKLKQIVHDTTVQTAAKTTGGWIARLLHYKQTPILHLLYTCKRKLNDWRNRHGEK